MKILSVFIVMFCCLTLTSAYSEEKWTVEKLYSYYETHYSPKETLHFTQKAALYVSDQCKKGKISCDKVIEDFSKPSEWGILDVKHLHITIIDVESWTMLAHPNPRLYQKLVNKVGLGKIVKDYNGKLIIYFGVDGIKLQPKGFFFSKSSSYVKSVSKIKEPLYILNLWVLIPGTTMVAVTNLPYRAKSTEELDKVAAKLNASVEEWSIIKGKVVYPKSQD